MKGVFTQIKYLAQGAVLREATNTGMIVGLPIATEHRKQILPAATTDITAGAGETMPKIAIKGDNPAFDHKDGDILHSLRVWIRRSSEAKEEAIECFISGDDIYNPANYAKYGDGTQTLVEFNPVDDKLTAGLKATWSVETAELTFTAEVERLCPGDTVVFPPRAPEDADVIGKVRAVRVVSGKSKCTMDWSDHPAEAESLVTALYYDYIEDQNTLIGTPAAASAPRGYVLYFDSVVYRTSVYGLHTITEPSDITQLLGNNSIENPISNLAFGAYVYSAASGFSYKYRICALDLRDYTGLSEETPDDLMSSTPIWSDAISSVDNIKDIYYLVTLTDSSTVHDIYESYINTSAGIYRQREKRYYVSKQIIDHGLDTNIDYIADAFGNGLWGDTDHTVPAQYTAGAQYADGYDLNGTWTYFNKDEDVEIAQAKTMAVNNERITYIGCEYATIDNVNIDGYHIAAIIAGWRSSLPLGYVADDMKIPLLTSIPCGRNYYSADDLDALSAAGWYMLQQEMPGMPVSCYMQKTTAYDSVEKGEESFIVALDYCMRDIRATLAPYIRGGLDNRVSGDLPDSPVTLRYLKKLNAAISSVRYKYITQNDIFAAMDIVAVRVSKMKKTASEIDVRFQHYYPNREIYVTGYVE